MNYSITEIANVLEVTGGQIIDEDAIVSQLLTDSRSLTAPEETIFFALRTANDDGHNYIPDLFDKEAEKALFKAVSDAKQPVENAMSRNDWNGLMNVLSELSPAVSSFFNDVMVMDEDTVVRENRLRLLNKFAAVFGGVANIGVLSKKK